MKPGGRAQINRDNLEVKHASKEVHDGENRKE
jgi:hypothetical protein